MSTKSFLTRIGFIVPLCILFVLVLALYKGLSSTHELPSPFLDKPAPEIKLADLYNWQVFLNSRDFHPPTSSIGSWYLVSVWASWCETCREEHPFLMDLARQGVVIYGLNYEDTVSSARKWLSRHGNPYKAVLWDGQGHGAAKWGAYGVPEIFLVDPQGIIRFHHSGPLTKTIWKKMCLPLIQKEAAR